MIDMAFCAVNMQQTCEESCFLVSAKYVSDGGRGARRRSAFPRSKNAC
jgi:hypothetical protein